MEEVKIPRVKCHLARLIEERRPEMSWRQFAELSGVRRDTINDMCKDVVKAPSLAVIARVCAFVPCDINELFELVYEDEKDA